jgi:hypothetical protein
VDPAELAEQLPGPRGRVGVVRAGGPLPCGPGLLDVTLPGQQQPEVDRRFRHILVMTRVGGSLAGGDGSSCRIAD